MAELNIAAGLVKYTIKAKGTVDVNFSPVDYDFVERLYNTFDKLDKQQDAYKSEIEAAQGSKKIFEIARKKSDEMKAMIDDLFQQPVCEPLFGTMNVYSLADGLPIWCNLLLALIDEVDANTTDIDKQTNPRIQKYMAKYEKYHEKYHK